MEPPSYDPYGQHYSSVLYEQTGRDPFPHPVMSSSGPVPMASNSGHSHQGKAHSRLSECDGRPSILAKSATYDTVEPPPRNGESPLRDIGNSNSGHVCHSPQHSSFPVYVSDSGVEHWR